MSRDAPPRAVERRGSTTPVLVVVEQTLPPDLVEHPGLLPLLKAPVRAGGTAGPRSRSTRSTASPCGARARSRPCNPIGHARPMTPQRMRRPRRQQRLDPLPQPVRHPPTIVARDKTHRSLPRRFQMRCQKPKDVATGCSETCSELQRLRKDRKHRRTCTRISTYALLSVGTLAWATAALCGDLL